MMFINLRDEKLQIISATFFDSYWIFFFLFSLF